jgi:hypothetical protein
MDLTSCHGQPVSAERGAALASRSALSVSVKTMVRDGVMGTPGPSDILPRIRLLRL